jgi:hypothetical protein
MAIFRLKPEATISGERWAQSVSVPASALKLGYYTARPRSSTTWRDVRFSAEAVAVK